MRGLQRVQPQYESVRLRVTASPRPHRETMILYCFLRLDNNSQKYAERGYALQMGCVKITYPQNLPVICFKVFSIPTISLYTLINLN
jgi:hypothetical protein